jgi:hypothetical protein
LHFMQNRALLPTESHAWKAYQSVLLSRGAILKLAWTETSMHSARNPPSLREPTIMSLDLTWTILPP